LGQKAKDVLAQGGAVTPGYGFNLGAVAQVRTFDTHSHCLTVHDPGGTALAVDSLAGVAVAPHGRSVVIFFSRYRYSRSSCPAESILGRLNTWFGWRATDGLQRTCKSGNLFLGEEAHMSMFKDLSNKPLIAITDGKKLGEIKDLYLDQDMRSVAAVFLGREGLVNRKTLAIARSAVQVFGMDAWLVSGSDVVTEQENLPESGTLTLLGELRGREIQSEGGTKVGEIEDVILDDQGRVLGFALGRVYMQGPLSERKSIAREAITNLGSRKNPMTTVLEKAESLAIPSV
jgi:uncharacterized protein YrrD